MAWRRVRPDPVGEGQESVWDYPQPPLLVPSTHVVIRLGASLVAESTGRRRPRPAGITAICGGAIVVMAVWILLPRGR